MDVLRQSTDKSSAWQKVGGIGEHSSMDMKRDEWRPAAGRGEMARGEDE